MDEDTNPKRYRNLEFWDAMTPARWALRHGSEALVGAYEAVVTLYQCMVQLSHLIMSNRRRIGELETQLRAVAALLPPSSRRRLHFPDP